MNGDDGADAVAVPWARDAWGVAIGLLPDTDLGRRFPGGGFRIDPTPETAIERVGGDELLFADGRSRGQPFVVLVTAPSASIGLRITARLVAPAPSEAPGAADDRHSADALAAQRFWRDMTGPLALRPPVRLPVPARAGPPEAPRDGRAAGRVDESACGAVHLPFVRDRVRLLHPPPLRRVLRLPHPGGPVMNPRPRRSARRAAARTFPAFAALTTDQLLELVEETNVVRALAARGEHDEAEAHFQTVAARLGIAAEIEALTAAAMRGEIGDLT